MAEILFSIVFCLILTLLITFIIRRVYPSVSICYHVSRVPGPERHPIFGNFFQLLVSTEQIIKSARDWAKKYYPVYSIVVFPFCSINIVNAQDAEIILSTTKHSTKGLIYNFLHNWLQEGLLTSNGEKWQQRRKLLTPSFHFNLLQDFLGVFKSESVKLVDTIKDICAKDNEINVVPLITDFTLFSINETAMGTTLDLSTEKDKQYHNSILALGEVVSKRLLAVHLYFDFAYYRSELGNQESYYVKLLHKFTRNVIKSKIEKENIKSNSDSKQEYNYSSKKRMAMLDLLIRANKENLIDLQGIAEEVDTFMFEGHDTTSMCISFTLMTLANNRKEQDLIVEEIKEIIGDDEITFQNLNEMKYLEMCIKESLRLCPSVPFISRVATEDFHLPSTGHLVKKDTDINIHIFDIHRDPSVYPEPDKFNPDRFLPENIAKRHPFAYIPFSAGPRNCIGQKFALLEIKTAIIEILRNFILEPIDSMESVTIIADLVLRPENGIKVKFIKRT